MLSDNYVLKVAAILLSLFCINPVMPQEVKPSTAVRFMFYNAENLFDTKDDPVKNDNDFLPGGVMRWNQSRYLKKINSVYKTIVAAGGWEPPALVALCEIENRDVLADLVYGTYLSNYGYGIVHVESPDERGIDVCFIYRKDMVKILDVRSWLPEATDGNELHTRSVLYAKTEISGDTINLIINHWPSRRGGVLAGESLRNEIAGMVRRAADSISSSAGGKAKIVIMGDFNSSPDDPAIRLLDEKQGDEKVGRLVNLAARTGAQGTYRYMGTWETIDQVIVSEWLLDCPSGLSVSKDSYRIFNAGFLLRKDSKYPGDSPYSTYKGYRYQGGFSDHLPVLLDLRLR